VAHVDLDAMVEGELSNSRAMGSIYDIERYANGIRELDLKDILALAIVSHRSTHCDCDIFFCCWDYHDGRVCGNCLVPSRCVIGIFGIERKMDLSTI